MSRRGHRFVWLQSIEIEQGVSQLVNEAQRLFRNLFRMAKCC